MFSSTIKLLKNKSNCLTTAVDMLGRKFICTLNSFKVEPDKYVFFKKSYHYWIVLN